MCDVTFCPVFTWWRRNTITEDSSAKRGFSRLERLVKICSESSQIVSLSEISFRFYALNSQSRTEYTFRKIERKSSKGKISLQTGFLRRHIIDPGITGAQKRVFLPIIVAILKKFKIAEILIWPHISGPVSRAGRLAQKFGTISILALGKEAQCIQAVCEDDIKSQVTTFLYWVLELSLVNIWSNFGQNERRNFIIINDRGNFCLIFYSLHKILLFLEKMENMRSNIHADEFAGFRKIVAALEKVEFREVILSRYSRTRWSIDRRRCCWIFSVNGKSWKTYFLFSKNISS